MVWLDNPDEPRHLTNREASRRDPRRLHSQWPLGLKNEMLLFTSTGRCFFSIIGKSVASSTKRLLKAVAREPTLLSLNWVVGWTCCLKSGTINECRV